MQREITKLPAAFRVSVGYIELFRSERYASFTRHREYLSFLSHQSACSTADQQLLFYLLSHIKPDF